MKLKEYLLHLKKAVEDNKDLLDLDDGRWTRKCRSIYWRYTIRKSWFRRTNKSIIMILSAPKFGKSMLTLELLMTLGLITSVIQKTKFRSNLYSKLRKIRQWFQLKVQIHDKKILLMVF